MLLLLNIAGLCFALLLLWKASDWLVESSVKVAYTLGVSQLVIGLTVVAVGTSAPEFVVTIGAAMSGQSDISVANVVGSNIFNMGFILGSIAVVRTLTSSPQLFWRDGSILMFTNLITIVLIWNLKLSRAESILLFSGLILYNGYLFWKKEGVEVDLELKKAKRRDWILLLAGLAGVVLGGWILRETAVTIARAAGISEWLIGATVVAAGTSAPEFATSIMATVKGHHGISAGNLVGSCIFNLLGVLGLAGILRNLEVSSNFRSVSVAMALVSLLSLILLKTGNRLTRKEGIVVLALSTLIWILIFL